MTEEQSSNSELGPMLKLCSELETIRMKRRIANSSNLSWLGILTMELRDDILKTLHSMLYEVEDKITAVNSRLDESSEELKMEVQKLKVHLGSTDEEVRLNTNSIGKLRQTVQDDGVRIDEIKELLEDKASVYRVESMAREMKGFATKAELLNLDMTTVKKDEFEEATDEIQVLKANSVTKTEFKDKSKKLKTKMLEVIQNGYAKRVELEELNAHLNDVAEELRTADNANANKLTLKEQQLRKEIKEVAFKLSEQPWMPKITDIESELLEKAEKADFFDLKKDVNARIQECTTEVKGLSKQVTQFATVIERFDEILLDKASKDDLKQVADKLPLFYHKKDFLEYQKTIEEAIQSIHSTLKELKSGEKALTNEFSHILNRFEGMRRENYEISTISRNFQALRDELALKAEKMDVFAIHDIMGKRDEINKVKDEVDTVWQQLELQTVLALELSRTLLKNGEPQNVILKQRFEVFKNFTSLLNWIHGRTHKSNTHVFDAHLELPPIPDKLTSSKTTPRNFSSSVQTPRPHEFPPIKS